MPVETQNILLMTLKGVLTNSTIYTYNALDLLEEIRDNGFSAKYSYHSNGTVKSLSVGDKLTTHYAYDADKNLTRQWTKMQGEVKEDKRIRLGIPAMDNENQTMLADYHYSYDGNGNRISKDGLTGETSYQYDTLNRLVKVQYPKGIEEFSYDKADNRIRRLTEKEEEIYKYDVCNRLVEKQSRKLPESLAGVSVNAGSVIQTENASAKARTEQLSVKTQKVSSEFGKILPYKISTFQYDNQGNLIREERSTEGSKKESIYSYDGFNRQKKIVNFENKVQVNHYDGEGLRHEMEENGKLVKFLYADREAVAEEKADGNIIRYIRGYDLVASDSESARTYYHYVCDEQGSITHILGEDESGSYGLRNYYEYGAFGDFRVKEEEVENRFGYNGEIFDSIGGQYYLRARYYNPVIGRFTQEDTYYGAGLNLYAYCRNLPVGYEDPSGHYPCETKQDLYKKYREQGMTAQEANRQANYDLIKQKQGKEAADRYLQNEKNKQSNRQGEKGSKSGSGSNKKFDNWEDMKKYYRENVQGGVTKFSKNNKPKGSPNPRKWLKNGGQIEIDASNPKTWIYTSAAGDRVVYENGYIKFSPDQLHPDTDIANIYTDGFTGNRELDKKIAIAILKENGYASIPSGYVLHHDISNGTYQLVKKNIHELFKHYGGHYYNKGGN